MAACLLQLVNVVNAVCVRGLGEVDNEKLEAAYDQHCRLVEPSFSDFLLSLF